MHKVIESIKRICLYSALIILLILFIGPVIWLFQTSIQPPLLALSRPPKLIFLPVFDNYLAAIKNIGYLVNSLIISLAVTFISIVIGSIASYGFSRMRVPGKRRLLLWILSLRMFPPIVTVIPFFLLFRLVGMIDTLAAIILSHLVFSLPLSIWLLKGFFDEIPKETEEAAFIDGASTINVLIRIVLPIAGSAIIAMGAIVFLFSWNEYLYASILTRNRSATMSMAIVAYNTERGILWGPMAASGIVMILPALVFFGILQKYLARILTFGVVKK